MIKGDGDDYDLLDKWSKNYDCKGFYSCEIGVREGGGSKLIMDNVVNNFFHVGVDPYGDRKYHSAIIFVTHKISIGKTCKMKFAPADIIIKIF